MAYCGLIGSICVILTLSKECCESKCIISIVKCFIRHVRVRYFIPEKFNHQKVFQSQFASDWRIMSRYNLIYEFQSMKILRVCIFLNYNYYLNNPFRPGHACHSPDNWFQFFTLEMNSVVINLFAFFSWLNEDLEKMLVLLKNWFGILLMRESL